MNIARAAKCHKRSVRVMDTKFCYSAKAVGHRLSDSVCCERLLFNIERTAARHISELDDPSHPTLPNLHRASDVEI